MNTASGVSGASGPPNPRALVAVLIVAAVLLIVGIVALVYVSRAEEERRQREAEAQRVQEAYERELAEYKQKLVYYEFEWGEYDWRHYWRMPILEEGETEVEDNIRIAFHVKHRRIMDKRGRPKTETKVSFKVKTWLPGRLLVKFFRSKPKEPLKARGYEPFDFGEVTASEGRPYESKELDLADLFTKKGKLRYPYYVVMVEADLAPDERGRMVPHLTRGVSGTVITLPDPNEMNHRKLGEPLKKRIKLDWDRPQDLSSLQRIHFPKPIPPVAPVPPAPPED